MHAHTLVQIAKCLYSTNIILFIHHILRQIDGRKGIHRLQAAKLYYELQLPPRPPKKSSSSTTRRSNHDDAQLRNLLLAVLVALFSFQTLVLPVEQYLKLYNQPISQIQFLIIGLNHLALFCTFGKSKTKSRSWSCFQHTLENHRKKNLEKIKMPPPLILRRICLQNFLKTLSSTVRTLVFKCEDACLQR